MIEEIIVHIGMHKTGSSSIQKTFSQLKFDDLTYLDLGNPNHSGLFSTILAKEPEKYHGNRRNNYSYNEVQKKKQEFLTLLETQLTHPNTKRVLISAEDLSYPGTEIKDAFKLANILRPHCKRIRAIGYVRSPLSFSHSAFQQLLKSGACVHPDEPSLYPYYRDRFLDWDQALGPENVELIHFHPEELFSGDVVCDFARRIGVSIEPKDIWRTNETLSLEATALLYLYRHHQAYSHDYYGKPSDDNRLIEALRKVGKKKLKFSLKLADSMLKSKTDDIEWINARLGKNILDQPSITDHTINCGSDLLTIACDNQQELLKALAVKGYGSRSGRDAVIARMEVISAFTAEAPQPLAPPKSKFTNDKLQLLEDPNVTTVQALSSLANVLPTSAEDVRENVLRFIKSLERRERKN